MTLHCGITRQTIEQIRKHKRRLNIVSRGGSLIFAWMSMTGKENPFYEYFDDILDICREYDVTISLGDACRPGCLADATDVCQIEELVRLGELTKRAREKGFKLLLKGLAMCRSIKFKPIWKLRKPYVAELRSMY